MTDSDEIEALEHRFAEVILAKDMAQLETLLAPEYRLVGVRSTGTSDMPRDAWLAALPGMVFHRFELSVASVEVFGDTALAAVQGSWALDFNGRRIDESFYVTDIWVRREGGWRIVRRHSSPYQPAAGSPAS
ncbi:MAG: SnoaL 3 multi-domain protein [Phenylobacterium sp.]|nr:SnoaL 3 multi-domain protein [Phenylobacterium sp.]